MRINGSWSLCEDGAIRPVIRGEILTADGRWLQTDFLVDTGADKTALDGNTLKKLGLGTTRPAFEIGGVGGKAESVYAETQVRLFQEGGKDILINGPFIAFTDLETLDTSVLGRDFLDYFAVIVDRPGDVVCLLGQRHHYKIEHH
jgi:hypothetical protein